MTYDAEYQRRYRQAHPEKFAEYQRRYRERNPEKCRERHRRYHHAHPERRHAMEAVKRAVAEGRLVREPCLFCDDPHVEAHHHDYSQKLAVTWLCKRHHELAHHAI